MASHVAVENSGSREEQSISLPSAEEGDGDAPLQSPPSRPRSSTASHASVHLEDKETKNPDVPTAVIEVSLEFKRGRISTPILPLSRKRSDAAEDKDSRPAGLFHRMWIAYATDYASAYKTLYALVIISNFIAMASVLPGRSLHEALRRCSDAAITNLAVAVAIRQPYVINLFYHGFVGIPRSMPLWLRHTCARVYQYGAVHSGAACCSFVWFCLFLAYLAREVVVNDRPHASPETLVCASILAAFLTTIIIFALPQMRRRYHNLFERWHRFGGWMALAVFWVMLVLFQRDELKQADGAESLGMGMVKLPATWILLFVSINAIWPYLLIRKVRVVQTENLSNHAIRIYFDPKEKIIPTHGAAISRSPLKEWHSFAAISDVDGTAGGSSSIVVSKAGDWTADAISNPAPYYYMKSIHMAGPGTMAKMFSRVVFMCTGSGVGPILAVLTPLANVGLRIIWSAPQPREVFGDKICSALLRADPEAIIWDTHKSGRPDLVKIATRVYRESDAEALFFISNQRLTKVVVKELRRKGIATFSPVFDS
ncbi:hypothetical protein TI39_contig4301g00005 [Zymoseptoria brevis]|uniref:Integral membrane protein TmpA n=1 Tax=Zymoseptoria brevis TaxID=1047168 RepID=A0A0F4G952_9PEZI|nr:hypothetical protein TI39_contig4301g00005 [Zymoseptoria brevis]